jgi:HEAT repeat protein
MTNFTTSENAENTSAAFRKAEEIKNRLRKAVLSRSDSEIRQTLEETASLFRNVDTVTQYKLLTEAVELQCNLVLPLLRTALVENESALVRHEAAFGLGLLGDSGDVRRLADAMLFDPHLMVRHEAAIALGAIGDETAVAALMEAVNDTELSVAESAKFGLEQVLMRLGASKVGP